MSPAQNNIFLPSGGFAGGGAARPARLAFPSPHFLSRDFLDTFFCQTFLWVRVFLFFLRFPLLAWRGRERERGGEFRTQQQ